LFAGDVQAIEKIVRPVLDQQIELVAKLFNDPIELPPTLEESRSYVEDGGRPRTSGGRRIYDYLGSLAVGVAREKLLSIISLSSAGVFRDLSGITMTIPNRKNWNAARTTHKPTRRPGYTGRSPGGRKPGLHHSFHARSRKQLAEIWPELDAIYLLYQSPRMK